jgi:threonine synthase
VRFVSSRERGADRKAVSFRQAIFTGLPEDGGLFVPVEQPDLRQTMAGLPREASFRQIAETVMRELLGQELGREAVRRVCARAFPFSPALRPLRGGLTLLELFHGPTCAFKDFGASFLAAVMEEFLSRESRRSVILVATSGDTGSAVARAFHLKRNIDVVILYPSGRVSALQEQQLTTLGGNVSALEILGSFDDCQRLVKEAFLDAQLRQALAMSSANSINLGRLLPQALYYIHAWLKIDRSEEAVFCVPSGNFGNLTAGVYAWKWGMPAQGFIAATNMNDVVPGYLMTGRFRPRSSVKTLSTAMDVGHPSNFERLALVFGGDVQQMRSRIWGVRITDRETRQTIRRVYEQTGILVDPHTAVGVLASERYRDHSGFPGSIVCLATAHPGKFVDIVQEATGVRPEVPPALKELMSREKEATPLEPELERLKEFLLGRYA